MLKSNFSKILIGFSVFNLLIACSKKEGGDSSLPSTNSGDSSTNSGSSSQVFCPLKLIPPPLTGEPINTQSPVISSITSSITNGVQTVTDANRAIKGTSNVGEQIIVGVNAAGQMASNLINLGTSVNNLIQSFNRPPAGIHVMNYPETAKVLLEVFNNYIDGTLSSPICRGSPCKANADGKMVGTPSSNGIAYFSATPTGCSTAMKYAATSRYAYNTSKGHFNAGDFILLDIYVLNPGSTGTYTYKATIYKINSSIVHHNVPGDNPNDIDAISGSVAGINQVSGQTSNNFSNGSVIYTVVVADGVTTDVRGHIGGTLYTADQNKCNSKSEVLIGFQGNMGASLNQIQAICARLSFNANANIITTTTTVTSLRGQNAGATSWKAICPQNSVIVGFSGNSGLLLDKIQLYCSYLSLIPSSSSSIAVNQSTVQNPAGGTGGSPFPLLLCPNGQIASAAVIRAGDNVDALGLKCSIPLLLSPR